MSGAEYKRKAETVAALYLEMRGFKVIERGWRLPRAKVDILAQKDNTMYFVEVNYHRDGDSQKPASESLSASALKQKQRAVYMWLDETKWQGDYALATVEVNGSDYTIMSFSDNF